MKSSMFVTIWRKHDLWRLRILAENKRDVADALNETCRSPSAEFLEKGVASFSGRGANTHLDQFMMGDRRIEFFHECGGQTGIAHRNDGLEPVSEPAQVLFL